MVSYGGGQAIAAAASGARIELRVFNLPVSGTLSFLTTSSIRLLAMIATSTLPGGRATAYTALADVLGISNFEIGRGPAELCDCDRAEMLWYIRRAVDGEIAFKCIVAP